MRGINKNICPVSASLLVVWIGGFKYQIQTTREPDSMSMLFDDLIYRGSMKGIDLLKTSGNPFIRAS